MYFNLAANRFTGKHRHIIVIGIQSFQPITPVSDVSTPRLLEGLDARKHLNMVFMQATERQPEGLNRAFEAFQEVGGHQSL